MKIELGARINEIRKGRGLTQYQLADMVNADVSTVNKIENNKANPSLDMLKKLAAALGVTVAALLDEPAKAVGE